MNTKTKTFSAKQIAEFIANAKTPSEKGQATRRLKAYVESRSEAGANPELVERNIRSTVRRISG